MQHIQEHTDIPDPAEVDKGKFNPLLSFDQPTHNLRDFRKQVVYAKEFQSRNV